MKFNDSLVDYQVLLQRWAPAAEESLLGQSSTEWLKLRRVAAGSLLDVPVPPVSERLQQRTVVFSLDAPVPQVPDGVGCARTNLNWDDPFAEEGSDD